MNSHNQSCLDNHRNFRVLLQAMSRPGMLFQLPVPIASAREAQLAIFNCLLDPQTSYYLLEDDPQLADQLRHNGARSAKPETADFLIAPKGSSAGQLRQAKRGRLEFPDEGATVLYAVDSLSTGNSNSGLPLRGPGIKEVIYPQIKGLAEAELTTLQQLNEEYPLGVDSIFVDGRGKLIYVPRSTRIGGI